MEVVRMGHPTDVEQVRVEGVLSAYRDLQAQFDRVRDRLRKAEEQKTTVSRRIFDRVRAEYDRELDAIRAKMSPLRTQLEEVRASLETQLETADQELESIQEELAEAEFRNRVGEFGTSDFESLRKSLDSRITAARARHDELRSAMASLDAMKEPDAAAADDPETLADEPVAEPTAPPAAHAAPARPAAAPARPAPPAPKPVPSPAGDAQRRPVLRGAEAAEDHFENPQDWIDELGRDAAPRRAPAPASAGAPAAKADRPRPAAGTAVDSAPGPPTGAPSLVFVGGSHAGQSIALLPTTLTIGREHDNNVELKDADVARYHARIVHERNSYVVEDLDSSTGTWVNGQRTRRAVLKHGDVIRVGQTELALDFEWASRKS
jgi:hypothetical protein